MSRSEQGPFKITSRWSSACAGYERVQSVVCSKCSGEGLYPDRGVKPKPPEFVAGHFRQLGWEMGQRPVCPLCIEKRAALAKPAIKSNVIIEAFKELDLMPPAKNVSHQTVLHQIIGDPTPLPPTAAAPRQPERADNVRIADALDEHYDRSAGRYVKNGSDKVLAAKLACPEAWVRNIRMLWGDDKNEAVDAHADAIKRLETRVAAAERAFLAKIDDALKTSDVELKAIGADLRAARAAVGAAA